MREAIKNFSKQFEYEPEIANAGNFNGGAEPIVIGMGGSALGALLLEAWKPELGMKIHRDYGLPRMPEEDLRRRLIILSSYSGNTEEVIDAFHIAKEKDLRMAAVAVGGKLLRLAREHGVPYVQMPDTGIQPRSALGFSVRALLKVMGEEEGLRETRALASALDPLSFEAAGKELAEKLRGRVPVIYASTKNSIIAYNWKIKFNETGKIPAFYNVIPELNHNEMNGFDAEGASRDLCGNFHFIFLEGDAHPRNEQRMAVLARLYEERGLPVERLALPDKGFWHSAFSSLLVADWAAYHTALLYGLEPEQVPLVEDFKRLLG